MIHVDRGAAPDGFSERQILWTNGFRSARANTPLLSASKYWASVRSDIRTDADNLARRFHFKCAFCESKMAHVVVPHIEHYRPKSKTEFESLMFDWDNWLLSCGICNTKKGRSFAVDDDKRILDPATEHPENHIGYVGHLPIAISSRGEESIAKLGLRRTHLGHQRQAWISIISVLLLLAANCRGRTRALARTYLIWCMQDEAPYALMSRQFIRSKAPLLANPETPHPRVAQEQLEEEILGLVKKHEKKISALVC